MRRTAQYLLDTTKLQVIVPRICIRIEAAMVLEI